jgi:uncharacterized membrane protein YjgN (DUF898 family)
MADGILKISPTGPAVPALSDLSSGPAAADPDHAIAAGSDLGTLVWRGNFLTIVTLGIYRFWYKTDLRRWYWRNTVIGGQGLEYRGTAREKFIGFLFALAVVLPLYFAGALVGLFASEQLGNTITSISVLIIAFLVQYGAYRSRRYRLTRTVWRGLRFDQVGSAWIYALKSAGWGLITLLTLGFGFPQMRRALEAYRINNTRFGTAEGRFLPEARAPMKRWFLLWGGTCALLGLAIHQTVTKGVIHPVTGIYQVSGETAFLMFVGMLWPFILWPWYRAQEFRVFVEGTRIGPVTFQSRLRTSVYYKLFLKFGGLMLGFVIAMLLLGSALFFWVVQGRVSQTALFITMGFFYLFSFLLFSCVKELVLNQGFWHHATETLSISNLAEVDTILGSAVADEAATGEGLADALDFGGV